MRKRRVNRVAPVIVAGLLVCLMGEPAMAQTDGTIEVQSVAVITENPRGDSLVLGTVEPGTVLEIVEARSPWFLVQAPDRVSEWRRGWIHQRFLTVLSMPTADPDDAEPRVPLRTSVRGFGQIGGLYFTASDSFDAVTGSAWGAMYGGGVQVGFSNGVFLQGSYDRYESTGQRVFVFENEIFELGIDNTVTVTPIQVTVGYRQPANGRSMAYLGIGASWYRFQEQAAFAEAGDDVDESKPGLHILGGVEYPITSWFWVGGEGQWAYAPEILGKAGISDAFSEDDLGGFTICLKLSVGL